MQYIYLGLLALASSVVAAPSPRLHSRAPSGAPTVALKNGSYYGVHNSNYNQDFFLGIPYAQPPLEDLRFSNPASLNNTWSGALPATNYAFVSVAMLGYQDHSTHHSLRSALVMEEIKSVTSRAKIVFTSTLYVPLAMRTPLSQSPFGSMVSTTEYLPLISNLPFCRWRFLHGWCCG